MLQVLRYILHLEAVIKSQPFFISYIRPLAELVQEIWLKDSVLALFPDTKDCSPALVRSVIVGNNYFSL